MDRIQYPCVMWLKGHYFNGHLEDLREKMLAIIKWMNSLLLIIIYFLLLGFAARFDELARILMLLRVLKFLSSKNQRMQGFFYRVNYSIRIKPCYDCHRRFVLLLLLLIAYFPPSELEVKYWEMPRSYASKVLRSET